MRERKQAVTTNKPTFILLQNDLINLNSIAFIKLYKDTREITIFFNTSTPDTGLEYKDYKFQSSEQAEQVYNKLIQILNPIKVDIAEDNTNTTDNDIPEWVDNEPKEPIIE